MLLVNEVHGVTIATRPVGVQDIAVVSPAEAIDSTQLPENMYISRFNTDVVTKLAPAAVGAIAFVLVAFLLFQVSDVRLVEWESEKVFLRFKEFENFWNVASRLPSSTRSQWVRQMCVMADAFTPLDYEDLGDDLIVLPKALTQATIPTTPVSAVEEPVAKVVSDAVPAAVPVSLNGVVAPSQLASRRGEMLQGSLDKLMKLYQNSMERMRTSRSSFLEVSSELSDLSDTSKNNILDQLAASASVASPKEMKSAQHCWKKLKAKVLDQRDTRRWRVLVKRAMMALGAFLLGLFSLACVAVLDCFTTSDGGVTLRMCDQPNQTTTDCSYYGSVSMCRAPCPNQALLVQYVMCYHDVGNNYYWVRMTSC